MGGFLEVLIERPMLLFLSERMYRHCDVKNRGIHQPWMLEDHLDPQGVEDPY